MANITHTHTHTHTHTPGINSRNKEAFLLSTKIKCTNVTMDANEATITRVLLAMSSSTQAVLNPFSIVLSNAALTRNVQCT